MLRFCLYHLFRIEEQKRGKKNSVNALFLWFLLSFLWFLQYFIYCASYGFKECGKVKAEQKELFWVRLKSLEKNNWEYSHEEITKIDEISETLNKKDKEGWEVFAIVSYRVGHILVIYRKKK